MSMCERCGVLEHGNVVFAQVQFLQAMEGGKHVCSLHAHMST